MVNTLFILNAIAQTEPPKKPNERARKALAKLEDQLREQEKEQQAKNRRQLKLLIRRLNEDKMTKVLEKKVEALNIKGTKDEKIKYLEEYVQLTNVINLASYDIPVEELPKILQTAVKRYRKKQETEQIKIKEKPNEIIEEIKKQLEENSGLNKKTIEIIEPLPMFILLNFLKDEKLKERFMKEFELSDNLLPLNYMTFENLSEVIVKKHKTGEYYSYNIIESGKSKAFKKMEDEFLKKLEIDEFKSIPEHMIEKFKSRVYEINTIIRIYRDFDPLAERDLSDTVVNLMVAMLHDMFNELPTFKARNAFASYMLRMLDILDVRNKTMQKDFIAHVKEMLSKKVQPVMSRETKTLIPEPVRDALSFENQNIPDSTALVLTNQTGEVLEPSGDIEHVNEFDEIDGYDDIFDDEDLEAALI